MQRYVHLLLFKAYLRTHYLKRTLEEGLLGALRPAQCAVQQTFNIRFQRSMLLSISEGSQGLINPDEVHDSHRHTFDEGRVTTHF